MEKKDFDVIIIGGGPGGLAAAYWAVDLGLTALVIEQAAEPGGQLLRTFNRIDNYLGAEAANGRELRDIFLRQIEKKNVDLRCGSVVESVNLIEKTVVMAGGERFLARAIVIATGVRRRELGIPGEAEFRGRGILESGEKCKNDVAGKRVLIVGGGDAALENALILATTANKVFIVHRRNEFRARSEFVQGSVNEEKIEIILNTAATAIIGNETVEAVDLENVLTGELSRISVDAILIRVGEAPNTDLFQGQIDIDAAGFVCVNHACSTSLPEVFAIGDVANPLAPTISSAVGMGATAAKMATNIRSRKP